MRFGRGQVPLGDVEIEHVVRDYALVRLREQQAELPVPDAFDRAVDFAERCDRWKMTIDDAADAALNLQQFGVGDAALKTGDGCQSGKQTSQSLLD